MDLFVAAFYVSGAFAFSLASLYMLGKAGSVIAAEFHKLQDKVASEAKSLEQWAERKVAEEIAKHFAAQKQAEPKA